LLDVLFLVVLGYALYETLPLPPAARFFPLVAIIPGLVFLLFAFVVDVMQIVNWRRGAAGGVPGGKGQLLWGGVFYVWLVCILLATLVIGQYPALVLFVALYLLVWARAKWWVVVAYTVASAVILFVLFDQLVPVLWYESPFFRLFG
jgi:hypothetical protein